MKRHMLIGFLSIALSACATVTPSTSYVSPITSADAATVASSVSVFVTQKLPPASSTILLMPPVASQANNVFTAQLINDLQHAGFALSTPMQQVSGTHSLRYLLTPMGSGMVVRIQLDDIQASTFYNRDSAGALQANAPFTVLSQE